MPSVTIEEAQAKLPELIESLGTGEEIVITRNARPIARLAGPPAAAGQPVFGRGKGKVLIRSEDDDHLKDFEDYMP
jgi:prevent-host-death family protein